MKYLRQAFTLPEIMFSIFILAVAVVSVMGLLAAGAKRQGFERDREIAGQLAVAVVEAAYPKMVVALHNDDLIEEALAATPKTIAEVPPAIAARLTSGDGALERAVGSGQRLVYLAAQSGFPAESQMRVVAAVDTPLPAPAAIPTYAATKAAGAQPWANSALEPTALCRTLVCWSVDWTQFEDFELTDSNINGVAGQQFGILSKSASLRAAEIGRFNFYNSAKQ